MYFITILIHIYKCYIKYFLQNHTIVYSLIELFPTHFIEITKNIKKIEKSCHKTLSSVVYINEGHYQQEK